MILPFIEQTQLYNEWNFQLNVRANGELLTSTNQSQPAQDRHRRLLLSHRGAAT